MIYLLPVVAARWIACEPRWLSRWRAIARFA